MWWSVKSITVACNGNTQAKYEYVKMVQCNNCVMSAWWRVCQTPGPAFIDTVIISSTSYTYLITWLKLSVYTLSRVWTSWHVCRWKVWLHLRPISLCGWVITSKWGLLSVWIKPTASLLDLTYWPHQSCSQHKKKRKRAPEKNESCSYVSVSLPVKTAITVRPFITLTDNHSQSSYMDQSQ